MSQSELKQLAKDICETVGLSHQHVVTVIIATKNHPKSLDFLMFEKLQEIIKATDPKITLIYEPSR